MHSRSIPKIQRPEGDFGWASAGWLRAAPNLIGHLFPRLLGQPGYNSRLKAAAPLMEAALRWLAEATPGAAELLRLMDATPVPCGQSVITARRAFRLQALVRLGETGHAELELARFDDRDRDLYAKLGIHRRAETVARARDLGLLAPSGSRR